MKQITNYAEIDDIFKKYKNKIYWLILSVVKNDSDAKDALQNTFLKVIQNLKNFQSRSLLSTWIYKIAYNEALMLLRKKRSQNRILSGVKDLGTLKESLFYSSNPRRPDDVLIDNELKISVDNAIKTLPLKYRMPILLHSFKELSLKEAASILNLNINSFKTRLRRANLSLGEEMKSYLSDKLQEEQSVKKCKVELSFIYNYVSGSIGKDKEKAFNRHIADCKNCKIFLNTYREAIRLTKALECPDIPKELEQRIKTFLENYKFPKISG